MGNKKEQYQLIRVNQDVWDIKKYRKQGNKGSINSKKIEKLVTKRTTILEKPEVKKIFLSSSTLAVKERSFQTPRYLWSPC